MVNKENGNKEIIMLDLKMVKKENGNQEITMLDLKVEIDHLITMAKRKNGNQEIITNLVKLVLIDKLSKHLKILQ